MNVQNFKKNINNLNQRENYLRRFYELVNYPKLNSNMSVSNISYENHAKE